MATEIAAADHRGLARALGLAAGRLDIRVVDHRHPRFDRTETMDRIEAQISPQD